MNANLRAVRMLVAAAGFFACAGSAVAADFTLPFKGEDFADDERVYWGREIHSDGGVQKHGYDLDVRKFVDGAWRAYKGTGEKNSDWYVYGKPVYAMRAGTVVACWRNAPDNPKMGTGAGKWHEELTKHPNGGSRIYGGGNGFWIEHDDGSRAEYAHFKPGSVPAALCPHNEKLMPEVIDSPAVEDAWAFIRVENGARVEQGQLLGMSGNVGTSSNPHLHIHRETGGVAAETKSGGSPLKLDFKSGLWVSEAEAAGGPFVVWKSFAGKPIPPGKCFVWPSRTVGKEYARHGFPAEQFGAFFQHLADSGFWPVWIDAYNVGGKNFLNHVWRPAKGPFLAWFLVDAAKYQQVFDEATGKGFAPVFVESSVSGGKARYTAIFLKTPGGAIARHGLTYDQHMEVMADAKKKGLVPVNISVVSLGGKLWYTVLYRSGNAGVWSVKSQIAEGDYQAEYNAQKGAGRRPLYVDAYVHSGKPFISAIFGQVQTASRKDRHALSGASYQNEYASALQGGLLTRAVTSFDGASTQHRFAAVWWK
jgi:hypothetical protein